MTYSYRSNNAASEQQLARDRQTALRSLLIQRQSLSTISQRTNALRAELEYRIARAIWDDVPMHAVASAAGVSVEKAKILGLAWEDLPETGITAVSHIQSLHAVRRQTNQLVTERRILEEQLEQFVVRTLERALLDAATLAEASGLTVEYLNALASRTCRPRLAR